MKTVEEQPLEQLREGPGPGPGRGSLMAVFLGQFGRLKRFVMGMGLSVSDAEDVLQDVSVEVLRHSGRSKEEANPTAWLFTVTANRVKLVHRRRGVAERGTSENIGHGLSRQPMDAQQQAMYSEEAGIIAEALVEAQYRYILTEYADTPVAASLREQRGL